MGQRKDTKGGNIGEDGEELKENIFKMRYLGNNPMSDTWFTLINSFWLVFLTPLPPPGIIAVTQPNLSLLFLKIHI